MSEIHIKRKHTLDETSVRRQVDKLAEKLSQKLAADWHWVDNRLEFKRNHARGWLQQNDGEIEITIQLGWILAPWKSTIENTIERYLDEALT